MSRRQTRPLAPHKPAPTRVDLEDRPLPVEAADAPARVGLGLSAVPLDSTLAALTDALDAIRAAEAERDRLVLAARSAGASWTVLARALAVSPQAVQQRYGAQARRSFDLL